MMISKEISASSDSYQWQSIDWKAVEEHVLKLQMHIAKATREGRRGKTKALQWILTHSRAAKLLAVYHAFSPCQLEREQMLKRQKVGINRAKISRSKTCR